MPDPVLHVIAGPNGAGKSTFYDEILGPATNLEFINADRIAERLWPGDEEHQSYEAATLAASERSRRIGAGMSFATETVFSHLSKVDLIDEALEAGYLVTLHIIAVPKDLAVRRVANRFANGGHTAPVEKVRARWKRLWGFLAEAVDKVHEAVIYDNTTAQTPFRLVALVSKGRLLIVEDWPDWLPEDLRPDD